MRLFRPEPRHVLTAAAVLLFVLGCSSRNETHVINIGDAQSPAAKRGEPITKIIGIWQPAEGHNAKGLPSRGLAANVMFFTPSSERPVKLEGEGKLIVYVFDDQGTKEEQATPLTRITFADLPALNAHYREGAVGPSYQFFIPYPRRESHQVKMSVAAVLKPKQGAPTASDLVTVTLPGPVREKDQRPVVQNVTRTPTAGGTIVTTLNQHSRKPAANDPQHVKQKFVPRAPDGMQDLELRQAAATQPKRDWQREIQQVAGELPPPRRRKTREDKIRELQHMIEELKQQQQPTDQRPGHATLQPARERSEDRNQTDVATPSRSFRLSPSPNAPPQQDAGGDQTHPNSQRPERSHQRSRSNATQTQVHRPAAQLLLGSREQPVDDSPNSKDNSDSWSSDGAAFKPARTPARTAAADPFRAQPPKRTARELLE